MKYELTVFKLRSVYSVDPEYLGKCLNFSSQLLKLNCVDNAN